jgi:hypothetical protein
MRRVVMLCCALSLAATIAPTCFGQMGMDLFRKPSIMKAFNPVVGRGAEYESTNGKGDKASKMELAVVGKDSVDGKEAFWMQFYSDDGKGANVVGKSLITRDDLQFHRMIIQQPGQPAMEMPNMFNRKDNKMQESLSEWHSVGTETITVPAGTFSCEHWRNEKSNSDVWTSDKVTPFGAVKEVSPNHSMVLLRVISDVPDRIKGPVQQFNMQDMMQRMQQQRQQQQKP